MTRTIAAALLLVPWTPLSADETPNMFAYAQPIVTSSAAAAYRLSVPRAVYQGTFREDLADVRVFNADGEIVASSLQRRAPIAAHAEPVALPLFPLPAGSRPGGLQLKIETLGSAVDLRAESAGIAGTAVSQYILDGRAVASAVAGLRLDWPSTEAAYSGHVRIEASEDLGRWTTVLPDAPIANLRANGLAIVQNRIALPLTSASYWRLSWLGPPPPFTLRAVSVEPTDDRAPPSRDSIETLPTHDAAQPKDFFFDLRGHAPVDRINLLLSEANTVATVEISSRRAPQDAWRPVLNAQFYRFSADGDHTNTAAEITVDRDRYWRARVTSSASLPRVPFKLDAEWVPDEITFLARGRGPFRLAYGSAVVKDGPGDFGRLPAGVRVDPASAGAAEILGGPARLIAAASPFPRKRALLWGVLIVAVAALAWMAYRLMNEASKP